MGGYRISRNFEASILKYIETNVATDWTNVNVVQSFSQADSQFSSDTPVICIQIGITTYNKVEVGTTAIVRTPTVILDIFANNAGQKLDLKDYLISICKEGMPYYQFIIEGGKITGQILSGRIQIKTITDIPINLDTDKQSLIKVDRNRHRITLTTTTNIRET